MNGLNAGNQKDGRMDGIQNNKKIKKNEMFLEKQIKKGVSDMNLVVPRHYCWL